MALHFNVECLGSASHGDLNVPRTRTSTDHDFELPIVKYMNSINEILLSVLYFRTYNCAYTDLVLSGCVVILKIFCRVLLYDFSVICILFVYCCKHVRLTCV